MKRNHTLLLPALLALIPFYFASCGVDRWAGYAEQTKTDRWIDSTMRAYYFWYHDLPSDKTLNYFLPPIEFFAKLRSKSDKFSTIDTLEQVSRSIRGTDYSYGLEFTLNGPVNDTAYVAHLLYVAHDSPAAQIGLQRGDWITAMDDEPITQKNYQRLYGDRSMRLTLADYNPAEENLTVRPQPVVIAPARPIEDNPVYYRNVYQRADRRIGYLVYNHFSFGPTDDDTNRPYDQALKEASNYFAAAGINELILDLRYNNGGYLSCAELLCTLLAPQSALGQSLGYALYNDRFPQPTPYTLDAALIAGGTNLNLTRLYVLTTSATASASEMLINSLKPYLPLTLIGQTTVGKNVGSISFRNEALRVVMAPIVCQLYNSQNSSDYARGFAPDYPLNENQYLANFLPFGNENELLLGTALALIDGTYPPDEPGTPDTRSLPPPVRVSSVDQRATAVRLNPAPFNY
jgi:C-terminal processing protease CtpA/Prc